MPPINEAIYGLAQPVDHLSGDHTLTSDDAGHLLVFSANAVLTVPALTLGEGIHVDIANIGSGSVTVTADGVTMVPNGGQIGPGKGAALVTTDTDEWLLVGGLS